MLLRRAYRSDIHQVSNVVIFKSPEMLENKNLWLSKGFSLVTDKSYLQSIEQVIDLYISRGPYHPEQEKAMVVQCPTRGIQYLSISKTLL